MQLKQVRARLTGYNYPLTYLCSVALFRCVGMQQKASTLRLISCCPSAILLTNSGKFGGVWTVYPSDFLTPRTPLTLINAPIRDLLRDVKDPKQREKLNLAARNIDRLSRLVDSLMDFSRLEAGRFEGTLNLSIEYWAVIDHSLPQVGSPR